VTGTESTFGVAASRPITETGTETTLEVASIGQWGELQVLLQSLVEYSTQLRTAGALDQTGFG
jgi:hypothetical protein